MAFSINKISVHNKKITHISGCLPTGKQAEMESRLNFHSNITLKTKVQGGATKFKFVGLM